LCVKRAGARQSIPRREKRASMHRRGASHKGVTGRPLGCPEGAEQASPGQRPGNGAQSGSRSPERALQRP
jgi:hypothetical protein